jgi:hypothetical protein
MQKISFFKRLKKHWLITLLGFSGLSLLLIASYVSLMHHKVSTPIARIEPKDSLEASLKGSKLEVYKKQIQQEEKEAYQRKMALDEIISMDFSQTAGKPIGRKTGLISSIIKKPEAALKTVDSTSDINRALPISLPSVKQVQRKNKPTKKEFSKERVEDGFQTIKPTSKELTKQESDGTQQFIKAQIFGNQKVRINGTVRLRLAQKLEINGLTLPENTILSGRVTSQINGRLKINIAQIDGRRVSLQVHDQDYVEGIAFQTKEVIQEVASQAKNEAMEEVLSSLPYGGIAGGLAKLGRSAARKTRKNTTLYLADGYEILLFTPN